MEGEADGARGGGGERSSEGQEFKQLKVRTSKDDIRSPRKSIDASIHSLLGGHGGPAGWLWRNSYAGGPSHAYPESANLYNPFSGADSSRCPSSPVHVPVTMAYTPAPGYVMFPVMISGAPDSPRGGLTPLMGSPVSTPTAMMFPQTPFAQHPSAGPFAPPQGPGGPAMRPSSISGAPNVSGGPTGHEGSASAYFHPLFNGFSAFGAPPGISIAPAPHGAYNGPAGPVMQMPPPQCAKQPRNSAAGDKVRPYQPSPLKPGPRKSSSNGGPPAPAVGPLPMIPLMGGAGAGRSTSGGASGAAMAGGGGNSDAASSPAQTSSTGSSGVAATQRNGCRPQHQGQQQPQPPPHHGAGYHTPAPGSGGGVGGYHQHLQQSGAAGGSGLAGGGGGSGACRVDVNGNGSEASSMAPSSASPAQPAAAASPEPAMPASYTGGASAVRNGSAPAGASATTTPRDVLNPTTAAAAAAVMAVANAAVGSMSTGPTPRTSYTGPSATPPPRNSVSGGGALGQATASGRTSSSGIALPPGAAAAAAAAAAATALGASVSVSAPRVSLSDESVSGPMPSASLDTDGVGLSNGDVDIPQYSSYLSSGMAAAHHMGSHAAAAAAASAAWGFYDTSAAAATAGGLGAQQMWPTGMPRLYGAGPHVMGSGVSHLTHHPHAHHHHHQVAAMAAAAAAAQHAPQQSAAAAAAMQQPTLLQAAMLQQLAAAANVQGPMAAAAMPCYVPAPPIENDYMVAAEHLAQLQALQVAQQNLRAAAAAAVADMQHPVMAAAAASAAGLTPGGMLVNPALLSGALAGHPAVHQHPHHLGGGMAMHGLGMGGIGPRPRRNLGNGVGPGGAGGGAGGGATGPDGQVRLNARQRRTLRRAKERAIRGLLEAGKLLVARTMGEGGAEGDDGAASGCDMPSGGYDDSDDGEQSDDGESPARPACVSARSVSAGSAAGAPSPDLSASSAASAAAPNGATSGVKYGGGSAGGGATSSSEVAGQATTPDHHAATGATGQQLLSSHVGLTGGSHSPSSSNASSVCEAGSSAGGRAISNTSSIAGPEASSSVLGAAGANSTPCSGKISPLSAEGSNETSPALPAAVAPPPPPRAGANGGARISPAPSGRSTSAGSGLSGAAGPVVSAAAALASGGATDVDITALIQQLNLKREEGLVDEKLLRDLEIINNLIGALKSNVPSAAPSYNAQGRKPSAGHAHTGHVHNHHHHHHAQHNMVNAAHAMQYLSTGFPKLAKGFAVGY